MTSLVDKSVTIAVSSWPVLAIAGPVTGVIAGVIAANIAHRLWQAGIVPVPVVIIAMIAPIVIVGLLVFKLPPGSMRIDQGMLVLDRWAFFDKKANLGNARFSIRRWYPDWTPVARGLQLHVGDDSSVIRIGVSDQSLMDHYDKLSPGMLSERSTKMPHAVVSRAEYIHLLEQLGSPVTDILGVARGAD